MASCVPLAYVGAAGAMIVVVGDGTTGSVEDEGEANGTGCDCGDRKGWMSGTADGAAAGAGACDADSCMSDMVVVTGRGSTVAVIVDATLSTGWDGCGLGVVGWTVFVTVTVVTGPLAVTVTVTMPAPAALGDCTGAAEVAAAGPLPWLWSAAVGLTRKGVESCCAMAALSMF